MNESVIISVHVRSGRLLEWNGTIGLHANHLPSASNVMFMQLQPSTPATSCTIEADAH